MAARKRASTQSELLSRAVKAGRSALRQARRRLPPDVRKHIDKTVKEGQKTIHIAIRQVETRLDRTARQADLEKAMKRLDELSRLVRNLASGAVASSGASRTAAARSASRKAATLKTAARKPAARKAAASKPATRKPAARKTTPKPKPNRERTDRGE